MDILPKSDNKCKLSRKCPKAQIQGETRMAAEPITVDKPSPAYVNRSGGAVRLKVRLTGRSQQNDELVTRLGEFTQPNEDGWREELFRQVYDWVATQDVIANDRLRLAIRQVELYDSNEKTALAIKPSNLAPQAQRCQEQLCTGLP